MTTTSGTNSFLPFAQDASSSANILTDAQYILESLRLTGNIPDTARRSVNNKAFRQATVMAAALAQAIADRQPTNIADNLTPTVLAGLIRLGLGVTPYRTITSGITLASSDIGATIGANGNISIGLGNASAYPNGFNVTIRNIGTGTVALVAGSSFTGSSDTINGVAGNLNLNAGNAVILVCDGISGWVTVNSGAGSGGSVILTNTNVGDEIWYDTPGNTIYNKNSSSTYIVVKVIGGGMGAGFNAFGNAGSGSNFGNILTATAGSSSGGGIGSGGDKNFTGQNYRLIDAALSTGSSSKTYVNLGCGDAGSGGGGVDSTNQTVYSGASGGATIKKILTSSLAAQTSITVGSGGVGYNSDLLTNGGNGLVIIKEYT